MSTFCATCFNYHRHTHTHDKTAMFKQPWDQEYTSTDCLDRHQKTSHQETHLIEAYRVCNTVVVVIVSKRLTLKHQQMFIVNYS